MPGTLSKGFLIARGTQTVLKNLHIDYLLMAGLLVAVVVAAIVSHSIDGTAARGSDAVNGSVLSPSVEGAASRRSAGAAVGTFLAAPMRAALDHVARRYRVSEEALVPIFEAAQEAGRERNIDPMLLIAVISIESRFNPYSQSLVGAQGLMQIIPRFYLDKIPKGWGNNAFLDPVINVRVGAQILQETIRRHGSLMAGLQRYGGAADDDSQAYANKVMAEKRMLDQFSRRTAKAGA